MPMSHLQSFCWEPEHLPDREDGRGEAVPEVRQDRRHLYAQGHSEREIERERERQRDREKDRVRETERER